MFQHYVNPRKRVEHSLPQENVQFRNFLQLRNVWDLDREHFPQKG